MATIEQNYHTIKQELASACIRAGRNPLEVRLVAVSKTVGPAEIQQAMSAGIKDFAENRTLLFKQRIETFPDQRWHFIGTIQTNKVKDFAGHAALVHSVASQRVLQAIDARMAQRLEYARISPEDEGSHVAVVRQPVLIEVNVSGEASKDGVAPANLEELLFAATTMKHISVEGLMTMAPLDDPSRARAAFSGLRELRDALASRFTGADNVRLFELSMGMTDDYAIAIEEGSTIIRIGRALWS
ncbi:MAG: YggS family pyridoxal phosphate-dependent enzyme [Coriobacteriia bacterium]|nr:YggS family pyridoxal phosphate-dependent enzyme [Coriobacteriia bacterium]